MRLGQNNTEPGQFEPRYLSDNADISAGEPDIANKARFPSQAGSC